MQFLSGRGTTSVPSLPTVTLLQAGTVPRLPLGLCTSSSSEDGTKNFPEKTTTVTSDSRQVLKIAVLGSKQGIKETRGTVTYAIQLRRLWDLSNTP